MSRKCSMLCRHNPETDEIFCPHRGWVDECPFAGREDDDENEE